MSRFRRCSICGELGHDCRSCSYPVPINFPKKHLFNPWLHYEWEEHLVAMRIVQENPDGMTLEDIGTVLGVTRERVRQICLIALNKLRYGSQAGAYESVEMEGEYNTYAFALIECDSCGEYFIRDGGATLCSACEPDPIPYHMPCHSFDEIDPERPDNPGHVVDSTKYSKAAEGVLSGLIDTLLGLGEGNDD